MSDEMKKQGVTSMRQAGTISRMMAAAVALAVCGGGVAMADDTAPPGRSIGYVMHDYRWAVYETKDGKEECPNGIVSVGPRELYKIRFPEDGTKRTLAQTELTWENEVYWPDTSPDKYGSHLKLAGGKTAIGLDLDGKTGPNDFTSPDGKPGIDNQLYRILGCITNYRAAGSVLNFDRSFFKNHGFDRILVEITDVDSLVNDSDVTVTTYRGRDVLLNDATGNSYTPGGTQRLDLRWGKQFIHQAKGKIVNGVLIAGPMDQFWMPTESASDSATIEVLHKVRWELKLTPEKAEGLIGGYADIESWYNARNRNWSTHHEAYGQQVQQSVFKQLHQLADGMPDAQGRNTAISSAFDVKFVQTRILHSDKEVAEMNKAAGGKQFADSTR